MQVIRTVVVGLILAYFPPQLTFGQSGGAFIRKQGSDLVAGDQAQPITLRGVNLVFDRMVLPDGNWAIGTCDVLSQFPTTTPVTNWYSEQHLQTLSEIGFNVVRMNLQYRIFEDDDNPGVYKASAWNFLDTYVQWATNQNLYLILDMHIPPGGLQATGGGGDCLWDDPGNQTRLVNLWREIARRYANEPRIAAYDILNEPNPTGGSLQEGVGKWQTLAQEIVDSVRVVDSNHLIIVERVNWIMNADASSPLSDWDLSVLNAFKVTVNDDNTIYDYHFYNPAEYALQNEGAFPDDGSYPEPATLERAKDGNLMPRDKTYLSHEMDLEARGAEPMFVGEWSPNPSTFNPTKGGYVYMRDLLDLMRQRNLNWTYYAMWNLFTIDCCTEGVVCCVGKNETSPAFQQLIDMFADHFDSLATAVETDENEAPESLRLKQNYPNPFNPGTTIRFTIKRRQRVTLRILDLLGREVARLADSEFGAGPHAIVFDATGLPSGVYFYRLQAGKSVETRKLLLMR